MHHHPPPPPQSPLQPLLGSSRNVATLHGDPNNGSEGDYHPSLVEEQGNSPGKGQKSLGSEIQEFLRENMSKKNSNFSVVKSRNVDTEFLRGKPISN